MGELLDALSFELLDASKTRIQNIIACFGGESLAEGHLQRVGSGEIGLRHDQVVEQEGEQTHQQRQHECRQHHAAGGNSHAAQGREFTVSRETAVGQQGGHQGGHRKGEHQKTRQAQEQHLHGRQQRQTRLGNPSHKLEHHPHRKRNGGEGGDPEQQRAQQLLDQPAIHQGNPVPSHLRGQPLDGDGALQFLETGEGSQSWNASPR